MKLLKIAAAFAAAVLLSGCSFVYNLTDDIIINEIEIPLKPISYVVPEVECVADEVHNYSWYNYWCSEVLKGNSDITVDGAVDIKEVEKAVIQIRTDYPEIFWHGEYFHINGNSYETTIQVPAFGGIDDTEIPDMLDKVEAAADEIIDSIPYGADNYEKVVYIHDYLIENTEYDRIRANLSRKGISHGIYGCLIEKKAVCMGYAAAFQYLMNKLGIECGTCSGSNHAWNYVKLDGEYFWIDVTWDDDDMGAPLHTYCLVTTEQLLKTRTFDEIQPFIPECINSEHSYIVENGGFFAEYDEKEVLGYIGENSDKEKCQIMFGSYEAYIEALQELIGKGKASRAKGIKELRYSRIDDMYSIVFIMEGD